MNEVKSVFASKTFWGAVVAVAGAIIGLTADEQADVARIVGEAITVAGAAMAVWGRVAARKRIT